MQSKKIMNKYILSICIPTYNRPQKLSEALNSVMPQLDARMEIVIRDDSSNEETKKVVQKFKKKYSIRIQYFKGKKIGLDAANLFLLKKSKGTFFWCLSDDDLLIDGGINKAINIIQNFSTVNFIWANFGFNDLKTLAIDREDGLFRDRNEVISLLGPNIGLLSTYILRREIAITGLDYGEKNVHGFSFASTAVVFWVLSKPGDSYFLRGPYILCKPTSIEEFKTIKEDKIMREYFLIYGVYFHDALYGLRASFDKKAVKIMLRSNFNYLWKGLIVAWIGGWQDLKGKRFLMIKYYWYFYECWIAIIIMMLPRIVNSFFYKIYKTHIKKFLN